MRKGEWPGSPTLAESSIGVVKYARVANQVPYCHQASPRLDQRPKKERRCFLLREGDASAVMTTNFAPLRSSHRSAWAGDAQDDGVATGTTHHRAHAVSVDEQRTQRPDRSAVGARRARRREAPGRRSRSGSRPRRFRRAAELRQQRSCTGSIFGRRPAITFHGASLSSPRAPLRRLIRRATRGAKALGFHQCRIVPEIDERGRDRLHQWRRTADEDVRPSRSAARRPPRASCGRSGAEIRSSRGAARA